MVASLVTLSPLEPVCRRNTMPPAIVRSSDREEIKMADEPKHDPNAGTTDQKPRWEGPAENRPRGYLPAKDDPNKDRDAAGENNEDPDRNSVSGVERKSEQ